MNNVSYLKISLSILVLGAALVFSYFMIFSSLPTPANSQKNAAENFPGPLADVKNPIKWQPNQVGNGQLAAQDFSGGQNPADENNFTKKLVENVFNNVQANNLDKQAKSGNFIGADSFDNPQKREKFDLKLIKSISDSEIKISSDNSKEFKAAYLKILSEINKKNSEYFKKNYLEIMIDVYQKLDSSSAKEASIIYKNIAADYLNVEAPSDWSDFHKKLIIYFKNVAIVFEAMAEYQQDPIKGYLAFEKIEETIINKTMEIKKMLEDKYKESGI